MSSQLRNISEEDKMRANYAEYLVKRKLDKANLLKRIGIILIAIVLLSAGAFVITKMPPAAIGIFVAVAALVWYLWRFTNVEYEYIIIQGTVEVYKIYGEKDRKLILEIKTQNIEKVAPVSENPTVLDGKYDIVTDISSGNSKDELYYVLYSDENGKGIIYLNVIKKTLDVFKYYRSTAVSYGNIH